MKQSKKQIVEKINWSLKAIASEHATVRLCISFQQQTVPEHAITFIQLLLKIAYFSLSRHLLVSFTTKETNNS